MHHGLICVLQSVVADVGVFNASVVVEAWGLRLTDTTRPGDLVAMDFYSFGRHLIIDGVLT